jgi:hypothetical protein
MRVHVQISERRLRGEEVLWLNKHDWNFVDISITKEIYFERIFTYGILGNRIFMYEESIDIVPHKSLIRVPAPPNRTDIASHWLHFYLLRYSSLLLLLLSSLLSSPFVSIPSTLQALSVVRPRSAALPL